ncbi:MAG TPA: glycerol-3-phosphate responsive antiterminator [Ktedonobacteraceae bacterium]|nr:glycerol-3-phosphate responsive antiterminator [Ktedonobacteraceae bacterium]
MLVQSYSSLLSLPAKCKLIPMVENRMQFVHALDSTGIGAIFLRHCSLFEVSSLLERAHQRGLAVYVNVDHIDGVHPDAAGMRYLVEQLHVTGIISNHTRILAQGKDFGLETVQRIFAVDSTGLEMALDSMDEQYIDVLDISPALVVPHVVPYLSAPLPLPFIASGLISTTRQVEAVLKCGALGVAVSRPELWA